MLLLRNSLISAKLNAVKLRCRYTYTVVSRLSLRWSQVGAYPGFDIMKQPTEFFISPITPTGLNLPVPIYIPG